MQTMTQDLKNKRLASLVQKIDEYLLGGQTASLFGTSAESLERLPNGNPFMQKKLGNGLRIRAQVENDSRTVILQIFLDPLRFWAWVNALGPLELFYMDPYGIEICMKKERWAIVVDGIEILPRKTSEIHEIVRIEIAEVDGKRKPMRIT
jgi:hypothetical protein